jgi:hypothetical protein
MDESGNKPGPGTAKREAILRSRLRKLTWLVIAGLVASGATAMPLPREVSWLASILGAAGGHGIVAEWIAKVQAGLTDANSRYPFLFYGVDWLAFGHFMIALAFIGPLRNPARNIWVYEFGMLASVLVIPFAFVMGQVRGIPIFWRLIDCSFGAGEFLPLWFCWRWAAELDQIERAPAK